MLSKGLGWAIALGAVLSLVGCSPATISSPWSGDSIDLLQDDAVATVTPAGENSIKVAIQVEGNSEVCEGTFEMYNSRSGIPLFAGALKSYKGSWNKVTSEQCKKAIGGTGGIQQYIDITDPPLFGSTLMQVCDTSSSESLCLAANTFKIEEKGM